jgi:hypothetical protein
MPPADLKAARQAARDARNGVQMRSTNPTAGIKTAAPKAHKDATATTQAAKPEKVGAAVGKSAVTKPTDKG